MKRCEFPESMFYRDRMVGFVSRQSPFLPLTCFFFSKVDDSIQVDRDDSHRAL